MGDSRVVIQRKLRAEGITFRQLVERVRCDMAKQYLQQSHIPITEMGLMLGYSETSAFSRAFRRWFGISPSRFRQR
ncbi:helix-turn-helix transcriptional regulator [Vibrio viridaestus]|uniref:AraC family transcriptional regulator n=1 Tax=Vibrio viridaestus TaxID=2487322 RepID=A0A3N9TW24_9VIBR|nr:helix-turn-helix transcriptional regulator [Vibrio viridaestus]RQW61102.1 AraC family transcriptional regulator [Vibrio viridaestus]